MSDENGALGAWRPPYFREKPVRPKGVVEQGPVPGFLTMGNRERLTAVSEAYGLSEAAVAQACARVFPNGERKYDDPRVLEVARGLMRNG